MTTMTVKELSKLYYLKKLIERDELRIIELRSRMLPGSINLDGMPRASSPSNKMEESLAAIFDIDERLKKERAEYIKEQIAIEEYIRSVDDLQIRLILSYRFVDMLTWKQIAIRIGGGNTEDSVKKMCYRFLKRSEKKS